MRAFDRFKYMLLPGLQLIYTLTVRCIWLVLEQLISLVRRLLFEMLHGIFISLYWFSMIAIHDLHFWFRASTNAFLLYSQLVDYLIIRFVILNQLLLILINDFSFMYIQFQALRQLVFLVSIRYIDICIASISDLKVWNQLLGVSLDWLYIFVIKPHYNLFSLIFLFTNLSFWGWMNAFVTDSAVEWFVQICFPFERIPFPNCIMLLCHVNVITFTISLLVIDIIRQILKQMICGNVMPCICTLSKYHTLWLPWFLWLLVNHLNWVIRRTSIVFCFIKRLSFSVLDC